MVSFIRTCSCISIVYFVHIDTSFPTLVSLPLIPYQFPTNFLRLS